VLPVAEKCHQLPVFQLPVWLSRASRPSGEETAEHMHRFLCLFEKCGLRLSSATDLESMASGGADMRQKAGTSFYQPDSEGRGPERLSELT